MATLKFNSVPEQKLASAGLRIICVVMCTGVNNECIYRVYTSDGGFNCYSGYNKVPSWVRDWMEDRNSWEYIIPSCMFVSGVPVGVE